MCAYAFAMPEHQTKEASALGAFRPIPYMGVIWVVAEAMKLGFRNGHPDWCNLGQGQPEVGEMEGAPPRPSEIQNGAGRPRIWPGRRH
jgi:hypothetical protein